MQSYNLMSTISKMNFVRVMVVILLFRKIKSTCYSSVTNFSDTLCGKLVGKRARIVGGTSATAGEFPWIVSIKYKRSHTCGGVVVNRRWIVTAAHCFCSGPSFSTKEKFSVSVNRSGYRNSTVPDTNIAKLKIHPEYSCNKLENDIALLELNEDISLLDADPACFPIGGGDSSFTNLENIEATAVGWGATNEDLSVGTIPLMLRKVQIPILRNNDCQQWYRSQNKSLSLRKSQMCAGYKSGEKDTCWADSGGPLMIRNERIMIVVGIVSTGIGCARASLPGIYTRLSEYINWMKNTIS